MRYAHSDLEEVHRLVHFAGLAKDDGPPISVRDEISADALVAILVAQGRRITRDQLGRWQRRGLLPRSRPKGLGRGLGTETLFPIVTVVQAAVLDDVLKLKRDFDTAGWRLWWLGFNVDERYWRPRLVHWAGEWDRVLRASRIIINDELSQKGDDRANGRLERVIEHLWTMSAAPSTFKQMRKALGRERFGTFVNVIAQVAAGLFRSQTPADMSNPDSVQDEQLFGVGLGFADARRKFPTGGAPWLSEEVAGHFEMISEVLSQGSLGASLENSSSDDLISARDQLRRLFEAVEAFVGVVIRQWGFPAFGLRLVARLFMSQTPDQQAGLLIAWLRIGPQLSENTERFIADHQATIQTYLHPEPLIHKMSDVRIHDTAIVFPYGEASET